MKRIYLDVAAAASVVPAAARAFREALSSYGNPSSAHAEGRESRSILEEARRTIAHMAGARPENLIFTSGATEANVLAIEGYVRARLASGAEANAAIGPERVSVSQPLPAHWGIEAHGLADPK